MKCVSLYPHSDPTLWEQIAGCNRSNYYKWQSLFLVHFLCYPFLILNRIKPLCSVQQNDRCWHPRHNIKILKILPAIWSTSPTFIPFQSSRKKVDWDLLTVNPQEFLTPSTIAPPKSPEHSFLLSPSEIKTACGEIRAELNFWYWKQICGLSKYLPCPTILCQLSCFAHRSS